MDVTKLANELRLKHCMTIGNALPKLSAIVAEAMELEREACAQLCLSKGEGEIAPVAFLAAAIRSRSNAKIRGGEAVPLD